MKFFLNLVLLLSFNLSFGQNDLGCAKFKTGTFTYQDPKYAGVIIKRTKRKQIEIVEKTGVKITYRIVWLGPCEYNLIQTKVNDSRYKSLNGSVIKVEIITVGEVSYQYRSDYNGQIITSTILKVSD